MHLFLLMKCDAFIVQLCVKMAFELSVTYERVQVILEIPKTIILGTGGIVHGE